MHDRRREPPVSVVASDKEIKMFSPDPLFGLGASKLLPSKWTCRFRLALAVNSQGVVHRRAAEQIAFCAVADVLKRARINKQRLPVRMQANAQCVGVAMTAALDALWTAIDDELSWRI